MKFYECYKVWLLFIFVFFFNDTATTEIYTLSLHDALPIFPLSSSEGTSTAAARHLAKGIPALQSTLRARRKILRSNRSEEHTSELQSRQYLVCRLLLEKKKITKHKFI